MFPHALCHDFQPSGEDYDHLEDKVVFEPGCDEQTIKAGPPLTRFGRSWWGHKPGIGDFATLTQATTTTIPEHAKR